VLLPVGPWRDELTGRVLDGGETPVAELLADYPVALLVTEEGSP
jgi:(1->4)-alpha-D-glucan 1-alpha-D-glucosylmutase